MYIISNPLNLHPSPGARVGQPGRGAAESRQPVPDTPETTAAEEHGAPATRRK